MTSIAAPRARMCLSEGENSGGLRSGRVVGIERPRGEREHLVTIIETSRLVIGCLQEAEMSSGHSDVSMARCNARRGRRETSLSFWAAAARLDIALTPSQ